MNPAASNSASALLEPLQVEAFIVQAKEFFLAHKVADLENLLRAPSSEVFHPFYVTYDSFYNFQFDIYFSASYSRCGSINNIFADGLSSL
jgi:hypothetical protein